PKTYIGQNPGYFDGVADLNHQRKEEMQKLNTIAENTNKVLGGVIRTVPGPDLVVAAHEAITGTSATRVGEKVDVLDRTLAALQLAAPVMEFVSDVASAFRVESELSLIGCFRAGTKVLCSHHLEPIESISLGQRVKTSSNDEMVGAIDPADFRALR